jgi:DNA polymerase III epsilon subunit-like protein
MKNILILDTETTGDFGSPMIYDFGYRIINPQGEVLLTRNCLISEVFDTKFLMDKAFYAKKFNAYLIAWDKGEIEKISFRIALKRFITDIRKYKVEVVAAYNLAFDVRALNQTMRLFDSPNFDKKILEKLFSQKNKKLLCIWNLACETVLNTDEYRAYCQADPEVFISEAGNYKTSAESAYRYLIKQNDFEESHTALSDVDIEIKILLDILNNYDGVISYGLHYGSWQKVQKRV